MWTATIHLKKEQGGTHLNTFYKAIVTTSPRQ